MACAHCELKGIRVFEDDAIIIAEEKPVVAGHLLVLPKQHYPIIEQAPDETVARLFILAAKASAAVFDELHATGTNIILQNGVAAGQIIPHTSISIIPRKEGDGLNFQWRATQLPDDKLAETEARLRQHLEQISLAPETEAEVVQETIIPKLAEPPQKPAKLSEEENYLIKQLERVP